MENMSEDQKVVDLLTKLKKSNGGYPSDKLAARRRTYLKQMANVGLGIGIGAGLKNSLKGGGNGAAATTTAASKVLEVALIAAIALEAGTAAYLYRDKIGSAIKSYISGPTVQEVTSSPDDKSVANPVLLDTVELPPTIATVTPSVTPSGTPSGTPSTALAGNNQNTGINANATPNPGVNQGNHYGHTPQPVRTKENSGGGGDNNNGGGGGGNNNGP